MSASPAGPAYGLGLATLAADGTVLDTWYPEPVLGVAADWPAGNAARIGGELAAATSPLPGGRTVRVVKTAISDLAAPPVSTADAYLRLHLLSALLVKPRSINLDGIFALLPVNAWTSSGPVRPEDVAGLRLSARRAGQSLAIYGIDHFPRMTDYVIPGGVRIANADRVRLGAYLAPGTVVMHEGFCNFNAGTLGACMVEGRISAGVVVGDGSDIGGGASIMGTLSGGGTEQVTIGSGCLIGANAGVGISLGDHCIVEAGLYLTAGSKVAVQAGVLGEHTGGVVTARELSGADGLLFRRNSLTGEVQALPNTAAWRGLNATLHGS